MSTLYISEYQNLQGDAYGTVIAVPQTPPLAEQAVAIGASSAQSAAFGPNTRVIQINCDVTCSVAFGPNPTAVTTAHRMVQNETRFYGVQPGQKIAVILNS